jgi:hypothetical protein
VAQGERQPHPQGLAALLQHQPGAVVDRRDVVGVEGMPEAESVCQRCGARVDQCAVSVGQVVVLRLRVVVDEQPEPEDVQGGHHTEDPEQPRDLLAVESQVLAERASFRRDDGSRRCLGGHFSTLALIASLLQERSARRRAVPFPA